MHDRRRLADSPVRAPSLSHHHRIWREQRRILRGNPDAYRVGAGIVVPRRRGEVSKIDWEDLRLQAGIAVDEKLYAGFDTRCPEVFVPDHHQRRYPGTPVWVDDGLADRPLYRSTRVDQDGILITRDELLSAYDPDMFGDLPASFDAWDVFNSLLDTGTSIYDRDRPYGEEELALALLADLYGDGLARDLYGPFVRDVVSELPHLRLQVRGGILEDPDHFTRYAQWHLPESEIRAWVRVQ